MAWRLRAKARWTHTAAEPNIQWHLDPAPLKATGQELRTAMTVASVRIAKRAIAALLALYAVSVCAVAANAWLLEAEVGGPDRWLELRNAKIKTLVADRRGLPMGSLDAAANMDAQLGAAVVPDACIDLVLVQEDRHHADGFRRFQGVDLLSTTKIFSGARGASTLGMQMARLLDQDIRDAPTLRRKRLEMAAAGGIESVYGGDARALAADYLRLATMGVLVGGGGSVDGLANFAVVMFGKASADMTMGECAIAVAALPSPIIFKVTNPQALARNDRVYKRALLLLETQSVSKDSADWQAVEARRGLPVSPAEAPSTASRQWQMEMVRPLLMNRTPRSDRP